MVTLEKFQKTVIALSTLIPSPSPNIRRREFCSFTRLDQDFFSFSRMAGEGGELARRMRASGEVKFTLSCKKNVFRFSQSAS
jgi:hypothetical protein